MKKIIKILLIEDDEFIRLLIRDIFWIYGQGKYRLYETKCIEEGENVIKKEKPDLIFLDLMFKESSMGVKSTLDFLEEIKSNPNTKDIKVIVFSGYPDLEKRVLELGAEKFLTKGDYLPKELFILVDDFVKQKTLCV